MNYAEYKFAQLLCVYDDEFKSMQYNDQFTTAIRLYNEFRNSDYNHTSKAEYDCICDYLSADQHKKIKIGNEIVEALKSFDSINAEVWKYVSEKLGYVVQEKGVTPLDDSEKLNYTRELVHRLDMVQDDAAELRKFIYKKGLGKYFQDSEDIQEGYVFLNNIDIACNLSDKESLGWQRYKQIID
jgi:hypothetical protein